MLYAAGLLMGRLVIDVEIIREEALDDMVLLAKLAGHGEALLGQGHPFVLLVVDEPLFCEHLDHLAHAGRGDLHVCGQLGGLGHALPLSQSEDVD